MGDGVSTAEGVPKWVGVEVVLLETETRGDADTDEEAEE